jgi:hypothetical protein
MANAGPPKIGAIDATAYVNANGPAIATTVVTTAAKYTLNVSICSPLYMLSVNTAVTGVQEKNAPRFHAGQYREANEEHGVS